MTTRTGDPASGTDKMSPREVYLAHRMAAQHEAERWGRRERILSHLRLAVFVLGLAIGWLAFGRHQIASHWFTPPVVVFLGLLIAHDRVIRLRRRADRTVDFFTRGLARIDDCWSVMLVVHSGWR